MTIKIERDSPLRVIDTSKVVSSNHHVSSPYDTALSVTEDESFLLVDFEPLGCPLASVGKLRSSTTAADDDTASTGSLSSDSYDTQDARGGRVSFADDIVTDVWTRPFTPRSEVSNLFYSTEETSRYVTRVEFYVCSGFLPSHDFFWGRARVERVRTCNQRSRLSHSFLVLFYD